MIAGMAGVMPGPQALKRYWKETPTQVLSCKYCEIFKYSFFKKTPPVAFRKYQSSHFWGLVAYFFVIWERAMEYALLGNVSSGIP